MNQPTSISHKYTNRLATETSPYLLQHAHNPVNWYPWGEEAFKKSREENKPIFLSVGYSTCYWCHVMERQSFENETIAMVMNEKFINIKVDREERPDVDQLYMQAVQIITRQGGWPMSVFLLADLRPFYGGTYFPPEDSYGRPGFPRLLASVEDAYRNRREEVERSADQITNLLRQMAKPPAPTDAIDIDAKWILSMIERTTSDYDPQHGGFGSAPKFPRQTVLELALMYLRDNENAQLMKQVRHALDAMAHGGIRDHLGGGFHRYSTDAIWLVPHFEIMLYDNAMLAWLYTEAYRQTEDRRYAAVARGICDFVLREMTSPQGSFYTAFDAEVDGQEGQNYLWTTLEVRTVLGQAGIPDPEITRFSRIHGLDRGPNFADPHHGNGKHEKNILFLAEPGAGDNSALLDATLEPMRAALYKARQLRKQPLLDTKILTSWNALMIRALAYAGDVLGEPRYLAAAESAADFLLQHHRDEQGNIFRTSKGGAPKYAGFLDDYAYLAQALLALEDAGDDELRREQARQTALVMHRKFGDESNGGFYFTEEGAADLIIRQKTASDSPLPSGNAVAAIAMLHLNQPDLARKTIESFAPQLDQVGEGISTLVQAAMLYVKQYGGLQISPAPSPQSNRPLTPAQLAGQVVSLRAAWTSETSLNVYVNIQNGFHINAHEASAGLLATQLSISGPPAEDVTAIDYPPGADQRFGFSDETLRVYTGELLIVVRFSRPQLREEDLELSLYYQPCDDSACLPAVTKIAKIATP